MNKFMLASFFAMALFAAGFTVDSDFARASTTLVGSTIQDVSPDGHTVTVRTSKGESLTLNVADREAIKGVKKGDQVSLEIGPDDRVHKIIKLGADSGMRELPRGRSAESE
jgi:hypothetical protein